MPGPLIQPGRQVGRQIRIVVQPIKVVGGAPLVLPPIVINAAPAVPGVGPQPLHVAFNVRKSVTPDPQRATVVLSNLSKATRDLLASVARSATNTGGIGATIDKRVLPGTLVRIEAGYLGTTPGALLTGNLVSVRSTHRGTDWQTTLEIGDSEIAIALAECRESFEAGTPALAILQYAAACMGLVIAPKIPAAIPPYILTQGFTAYGRARDVIDGILAGVAPDLSGLGFIARGVAIGLDLYDAFAGNGPLTEPIGWWVEDSTIYFLEVGKALPGPPTLVSATPEPGSIRMVERPERLEDGAVRVVTLLHPGIRIARPLAIVSRELAGAYRVESVEHRGDNRSGDFLSIADLRPLTATA